VIKRFYLCLLTCALCLGIGGAHAQSYPGKPVRIIIPFPPGNTTDIMSRLIAPKMSERLGQQVVVENRPGASGMLGLDYAAKSAPDGYTVACVQGGNMVVLPHTSKNIPYKPLEDFLPVAVTTTNYLGIVANVDAPFKTIGEMVKFAKANPGKLTVATNGEGGFPHLAFEHLRTMADFTYTHVPYKGSAAIATDNPVRWRCEPDFTVFISLASFRWRYACGARGNRLRPCVRPMVGLLCPYWRIFVLIGELSTCRPTFMPRTWNHGHRPFTVGGENAGK
jgi:hypothetical protein